MKKKYVSPSFFPLSPALHVHCEALTQARIWSSYTDTASKEEEEEEKGEVDEETIIAPVIYNSYILHDIYSSLLL